MVISECKEVLFASKSDRYDWPNKMGVDILVKLYCSWLGFTIILFLGFCPFAAIVDKSLCMVNEFNVGVCKMFL